MSMLIKKCVNCRVELPELINGIQCEKCQKNEAKYGKPTTCKFCQLNAAFHEQKCVYCSHSERKFGNPVSCANCKLTSAFRKNTETGAVLCRLCILQAQASKQTTLAGVSVSNKEQHQSSRKHTNKRKRTERSDESSAKTNRSNEQPSSHTENLMQVQQLKETIARLNLALSTRDATILDRDKTIASLKADLYGMEKKHRERIQQLQKEKDETVSTIREQQRRQASTSKQNKKP